MTKVAEINKMYILAAGNKDDKGKSIKKIKHSNISGTSIMIPTKGKKSIVGAVNIYIDYNLQALKHSHRCKKIQERSNVFQKNLDNRIYKGCVKT